VKALLCTLFLLAGVLQAEIDPGKFACSGTISGSATYVLNQGITGVASSTINLSSALGAFVTVSGTASSIDYQFSGNGTSGWETMFTMKPGTGSYCIPKMGAFMRLVPSINSRSGAKTSAYYYPVDSLPTGGVATAAAQATTNALLAALTQSAGAVTSVTTIAAVLLSETAQSIDLTVAAGVGAIPLQVQVNCTKGPAPNIRYSIENIGVVVDAAWLKAEGAFLAASSTTQVETFWTPGHKLWWVAEGGASAVVSVKLRR
jgi:hypothetical protein